MPMRWASLLFGLAFVFSAPGLGSSDGASHDALGKSVLIQLGEPRSASTYQWMTLILIAEILAAKTNRYIHYQFVSKPDADKVRSLCPPPSEAICVLKAHRFARSQHAAPTGMDDLIGPSGEGGLFMSVRHANRFPTFSSSLENASLVTQDYDEFVHRSTIENVEAYKDVFGLTDIEVLYVQEFLSLWGVVRQCCGTQASVDQRNALHGLTDHPHHKGYMPDSPHCGIYNLTKIGYELAQTGFAQGFSVPIGGGEVAANDPEGTVFVKVHMVPFEASPKGINESYLDKPESEKSHSNDDDDHDLVERIVLRHCIQDNDKIKQGQDFNGKKWDGKEDQWRRRSR